MPTFPTSYPLSFLQEDIESAVAAFVWCRGSCGVCGGVGGVEIGA